VPGRTTTKEHPVTTSNRIALDTPDGLMAAYAAHPDGDARGGVLVVQEAFGLTGYLRHVADELAAAGWYALAPAFFHRTGGEVLPYDVARTRPHMAALTREGIDADLDTSFAHLAAAGFEPSRTGVVGFCMGGSIAFFADALRPVGAAVTYYGGGVAAGRFGFPPQPELAPGLHGAWLGLYGDLDRGIPVEEVEALRAAAATAAVPTQVVRYPDAGHGFGCYERPDVYRADDAVDAWARTLAWFDAYLAA
jgi:carboxymethylenebutenolidase